MAVDAVHTVPSGSSNSPDKEAPASGVSTPTSDEDRPAIGTVADKEPPQGQYRQSATLASN